MKHVKMKTASLQKLSINEKWLQKEIAASPDILGLGNVILRDTERRQEKAGRLDLLLEDIDNDKRYEVEIQLGVTDPSHIIRTIEYWDKERQRYPQYAHCAVIVAEDITSRFFNVIRLFNGHIPIIAIKLTAVEYSETEVGLLFTKVLDEISLGIEEPEREDPADESYWLNQTDGKARVSLIKKICKHVEVTPYYTKSYTAIETPKNGKTTKVKMELRAKGVQVIFNAPKKDDEELNNTSALSYKNGYQLNVPNSESFEENKDIITKLYNLAINPENSDDEITALGSPTD